MRTLRERNISLNAPPRAIRDLKALNYSSWNKQFQQDRTVVWKEIVRFWKGWEQDKRTSLRLRQIDVLPAWLGQDKQSKNTKQEMEDYSAPVSSSKSSGYSFLCVKVEFSGITRFHEVSAAAPSSLLITLKASDVQKRRIDFFSSKRRCSAPSGANTSAETRIVWPLWMCSLTSVSC